MREMDHVSIGISRRWPQSLDFVHMNTFANDQSLLFASIMHLPEILCHLRPPPLHRLHCVQHTLLKPNETPLLDSQRLVCLCRNWQPFRGIFSIPIRLGYVTLAGVALNDVPLGKACSQNVRNGLWRCFAVCGEIPLSITPVRIQSCEDMQCCHIADVDV